MDTPHLGRVLALTAGLASYLLYFHHGERHLHPYSILQVHLLLAAITLVARQQYFSEPFSLALRTTIHFSALYLLSLFTSTILYRLFLNPLNRAVPHGPFFARLTKFRHTYQNRTFKGHQALLDLHRKHNTNFIRLGPNDISVTDPAAVAVISAPSSKCYKAEWYSNDAPLTSMHTTRDRQQHDRRRKVWAPAFSPQALRGYESRIGVYSKLLVEGLREGKFDVDQTSKAKGVNVSDIFNWYSFDVMGDLAFGRSFGCLEGGETHWAIQLLNEGMKPAGLALPGWLFRVIIAIPGAAKDYWRFIDFCSEQLRKRMGEQGERNEKLGMKGKGGKEGGGEEKDITHTLIAHYEGMSAEDQRKALPMLQGDSRLIIVAGSDTTAATLVYMFYWLAKMPELVKKIRKETESCREEGAHGFSDRKLVEAETLNGAIYEALRLNPPVPSGIFRKTPKEGVYIGEKFIPGRTTIQMPWYVMGHDEKNYARPEEFLPERWSASQENKLVHHKDAFQSFSSGPYGCIGKNLALLELRTVTAQLLDQFDVSLADGEDGKQLMDETIDHFTLGLAPLRLRFEERR